MTVSFGGAYPRTAWYACATDCNLGALEVGFRTLKPKASDGLAALAVVVQLVAGCSDQERFRGRTTEQVKQACDPQRQTPEECSRTLDR